VHVDARVHRSKRSWPLARALDAGTLVRQAFTGWNEDNVPRLGAALAYYTLFSLAPLLLAAVAIAGLAFGRDAAMGRIVAELESVIGRPGAAAVQELARSSWRPGAGIVASLVALVMLLAGATDVFIELRSSLDAIWEVKPPAGGIGAMVKARLAAATVLQWVNTVVSLAILTVLFAILFKFLPGT